MAQNTSKSFKSLCLILTWGVGLWVSMTCSIPGRVRGSHKLWALIFISLFVICLTSRPNNRQTKGWLLHRRVWQQTPSVWQHTSSRSGNRQIKGGSVIGLFLRADSTTEGLATVKQTVWQQTKPLSYCG